MCCITAIAPNDYWITLMVPPCREALVLGLREVSVAIFWNKIRPYSKRLHIRYSCSHESQLEVGPLDIDTSPRRYPSYPRCSHRYVSASSRTCSRRGIGSPSFCINYHRNSSASYWDSTFNIRSLRGQYYTFFAQQFYRHRS